MKRPYTPQRMLWVVRKDGMVKGKRHRSQGKAERFVEKMKGQDMAQFESERFNVEEYETLADVYTGVGESGSDWSTLQSIIDASHSMLELCVEIRRLQGMEDRLKSLMAHYREQIAKDRTVAAEQGESWLGVNTHTIAANWLDSDLKNLERVLNG